MSVTPWWWLAAAILLAAAEMLTVSLVLVWSALAAALTGIALWLLPELSLAVQVALFALLSIAFTFGGRAAIQRFGDGGGAETHLNRRTAGLVGRKAVVVDFGAEGGQVTIDGIAWRARLEVGSALPAAGDLVEVTGLDGIVLTVRA